MDFCRPIRDTTCYGLPIFEPNDYLFKTHKDKGETKADIFAWAARDAMAKAGNFEKFESKIRDKHSYQAELGLVRFTWRKKED